MKTIKNQGITLIELIIVISIIGILAVALGFEFTGWMGGYRVESQMKEMYVDLMNARARAMQRNRVHFVRLLNATSYTIYEDDSDGTSKVPDGDGTLQTGTGSGADTRILPPLTSPEAAKPVEYNLRWNSSDISTPVNLTFNTKGLATTLGTISVFVDRDGDGERDFEPDYDCIVIASTRINMGKWNGSCVAQ
jgi:prepilin-type N-terminal cleavage/methylation domain-containing protein